MEGRIEAAPIAVEFDWPERPESTPLVLTGGGEKFTLIDHGRRGMGRLYELGIAQDAYAETVEFKIGYEPSGWVFLRARGKFERPVSSFRQGRMLTGLFTSQQETGPGAVFSRPDQTWLFGWIPEEARGTVFLLSSLQGMTAGERSLLDELVERNWCVLWTSASLAGLTDYEVAFPEAPPDSDDQLEVAAITLARLIDQNLAERAYAMEALVDFAYEERPSLRSLPLVGIGCSAGAIALSTTAARLDGAVDAAVFVAGGADVCRITTRSSLLGDELHVSVGGRPAARSEITSIAGDVLSRSKLDPYHTAAALVNTPVLLLHAPFDSIVPAEQGDVLYDRLGRPERWTYFPCGHVGLFVWLPTQIGDILDWIERAVQDKNVRPGVEVESP